MNRPYVFCHMMTSLDGKIMGILPHMMVMMQPPKKTVRKLQSVTDAPQPTQELKPAQK